LVWFCLNLRSNSSTVSFGSLSVVAAVLAKLLESEVRKIYSRVSFSALPSKERN
jgi:hypothetical protein